MHSTSMPIDLVTRLTESVLPQFISDCVFYFLLELQGHAIKNQDLLIASGTISLRGTEGMNAVDEDVAAAVSLFPLGRDRS